MGRGGEPGPQPPVKWPHRSLIIHSSWPSPGSRLPWLHGLFGTALTSSSDPFQATPRVSTSEATHSPAGVPGGSRSTEELTCWGQGEDTLG